MAGRIVAPEDVQGLIGKDHAEAERIVGPVAFIQRNLIVRMGFLDQDREIKAGRAAAENGDLHVRNRSTASPVLSEDHNPEVTLSLKYLAAGAILTRQQAKRRSHG